MPSPRAKQGRPEAVAEGIPALQTPKRRRKTKPSFGRDVNGPASSPPPAPTRLLTPETRGPRRRSSATSFSIVDLDSESEDDSTGGDDTGRVHDDVGDTHLFTPSSTTQQVSGETSRALPKRAKLRSFPSAPASSNPGADRGDGSPRPAMHQRCASDQTPQPRTAAQIDRAIAKLIEDGPIRLKGDPKRQKTDRGHNYVLTAESHDDGLLIYKVGISVPVEDRIRAIQQKCKFIRLKEHPHATPRPIEMYREAEKLMHAELERFLYHKRCLCGTMHKEWYLVEHEELVLQVFNRWHTFCSHNPWDVDGRLRPRWRFRLDNRPHLRDCDDHDGLVKAWQQFASPTPFQERVWDARFVCSKMSPYRWQILAFVETVAIAIMASLSVWALLWTTSIAVCILVESMQLGDTWSFNRLLELIDRMELQPSAPGKQLAADSELKASARETAEEEVLVGADDGASFFDMESETGTPGRPVDHRDVRTEAPGAWNDESDDTSELGESSLISDMGVTAGLEEDEDVDMEESILTEQSDTSTLGASLDCPIVIT